MLKRNWPNIYPPFMALMDLIVFNAAFLMAVYFRYSTIDTAFYLWEKWMFVNIVFLPLALSVGVYRGIFQSSLGRHQDTHLKKFTLYLALFTMSYLFLVHNQIDTRGIVIIFLVFQYAFLTLNHAIMNIINRTLVKRGFGSKNTLIVGSDISVCNFSEYLHDIFGQYYNVKGFVSNGTAVNDKVLLEKVVGRFEEMDKLIEKYDVKQVFIVSRSMLQKNYDTIRRSCEKFGIKAKMVSPYVNNLMRQFNVKDVTGVPLTVDASRRRFRTWNKFVKSVFDKMFVMLFSVVLIPAGLLISLIIKLTSKGPVLFKQKRALYKGGPEFTFYKFRTMYENADELKVKFLEHNESNGALFKMRNDPRITPFGRILRKYSLDELPQFINVLKNDMSVIGPRPLPIRDFEMIKNGSMNYDWYIKRGDTKPGITGLWQVSGRSNMSFEEMCLLDLYYVENHSIFLDLEILFETVPAMLMGKGAY